MTTSISGRPGQFTYFDHQLGGPDWTGKRVLDYGGKFGHMLLDPNCRIEPRDYWSIDVSQKAIAEGRRRHPEAHFIFHDRYNYKFNPTGTKGLPIPDPGVRFDIIVAFSFVNYSKGDTLELIDQLMALLTADGKLAFSFLDPLWTPPPDWPHAPEAIVNSRWTQLYEALGDRLEMSLDELLTRAKKATQQSKTERWSNLREYLEFGHVANPAMDVAKLLEQARHIPLTWLALVDGDKLIIDADDGEVVLGGGTQNSSILPLWAYLSFCTAEYMGQLLPNARIVPPAEAERLHCAIIDARKGPGQR